MSHCIKHLLVYGFDTKMTAKKCKSEEVLNIKFIFVREYGNYNSSRNEELRTSRETVRYCSCNSLVDVLLANKYGVLSEQPSTARGTSL